MKNELPDITRRAIASASESTRRRNPEIFGRAGPVAAGLRADEPERSERRQSEDSSVEAGAEGVEYSVAVVAFRRRLLDKHDNLASACKPLTDRITEWLGFDTDNHPRLHWEFLQHETRGRVGVVVKIDKTFQLSAQHRK